MIYYFTPYSTERNLGKAYNNYMRLLPSNEDWACLLDADTMFLCNDFGNQINDIVNKYPDTGMFTCVTNRAGYEDQRYNGVFSYESDICKHKEIAIECKKKYYCDLKEINSHINGHLILIKKSTWLKVGGFSENTIRDENADSNLLGLDDNISRKILKENLKIMLMKGVYLFHYYRLVEGVHYREHLLVNNKIKLGVSYNLCTGSELLRDSILSIRKNVDYITVIYNEISVNNIHTNIDLKEFLQKLKDEKLIDDFKLFVHTKEIAEKEIHNKHKEISQRNEGLQMCIENQCTYFMSMDCDEFYLDDEFRKAKEEIINNNFESSFCKMVSYYKDESHIIDPPEEYFVPFIYKIIENNKFHIQEFPVLCDPSRQYNKGKYKIFDRKEIQMHHFTYVRKNIGDKLFNAPTKEKYLGHYVELEKYYNDWKKGMDGLTYNGIVKLKEIKPYFKLHISENDKIYVGMATIPEREDLLKEVVSSIIDQCDELHIYFNNYKSIPEQFKNNDKIFCYDSEKESGDIGDTGKFYGLQNKDGYLFTIDDDLIYPKNYISTMIEGIKKYNTPVTMHGRIMNEPPIESYYKGGAKENFNYDIEVEEDQSVHICGTGCFGWHSDIIKFDIKDFENKNMSDIYASIKIHKHGLYLYVLAHKDCYIIENNKVNQIINIRNYYNLKDEIQAKLINDNYKYFKIIVKDTKKNIIFAQPKIEINEIKHKSIIKKETGGSIMTIIKSVVVKETDNGQYFEKLGEILHLEESTFNVLKAKGLVVMYDEDLKKELIKDAENTVIEAALVNVETSKQEYKNTETETQEEKAAREEKEKELLFTDRNLLIAEYKDFYNSETEGVFELKKDTSEDDFQKLMQCLKAAKAKFDKELKLLEKEKAAAIAKEKEEKEKAEKEKQNENKEPEKNVIKAPAKTTKKKAAKKTTKKK